MIAPDSDPPTGSLFKYVHGNVCSFCVVEKFDEVLLREPERVKHLCAFNMLYVCCCWDFNKRLQCPTTIYMEDRDHLLYTRKQQSLETMIEPVFTGRAQNISIPGRRRASHVSPSAAGLVGPILGTFGLPSSYTNAILHYICRLAPAQLIKLCKLRKVHPDWTERSKAHFVMCLISGTSLADEIVRVAAAAAETDRQEWPLIHHAGRCQPVGLSTANLKAVTTDSRSHKRFFNPYPPGIDEDYPSALLCYYINISTPPSQFHNRYLLPILLACIHVHPERTVISDDDMYLVNSLCHEMQVPIQYLPDRSADSILNYIRLQSHAALSVDVNLVSTDFQPGSQDLEQEENNFITAFRAISEQLSTYSAIAAVSATVRFHSNEIAILRFASPDEGDSIASYEFHCVDPKLVECSDGNVPMTMCTRTICLGSEALTRYLSRVWKLRPQMSRHVNRHPEVIVEMYIKPSLPRNGFGLWGDHRLDDLTVDMNTFRLGIPITEIIKRNRILFNQSRSDGNEPVWDVPEPPQADPDAPMEQLGDAPELPQADQDEPMEQLSPQSTLNHEVEAIQLQPDPDQDAPRMEQLPPQSTINHRNEAREAQSELEEPPEAETQAVTLRETATSEPALEHPWDTIPETVRACMAKILSKVPRRSGRSNPSNSVQRRLQNNTLWSVANQLCVDNDNTCTCRPPSNFRTRYREGILYCVFTENPHQKLLPQHLNMFEAGRQWDGSLVDSVIGVHSIEQHRLLDTVTSRKQGLTLFLPTSLFQNFFDSNQRVDFKQRFKGFLTQSCVTHSFPYEDNREVDFSADSSEYNYLFIPIIDGRQDDSGECSTSTSAVIVDKDQKSLYLLCQRNTQGEFETIVEAVIEILNESIPSIKKWCRKVYTTPVHLVNGEVVVCLLAYLFVQKDTTFVSTCMTLAGFDDDEYIRFRLYCALTVVHNRPIPWSVLPPRPQLATLPHGAQVLDLEELWEELPMAMSGGNEDELTDDDTGDKMVGDDEDTCAICLDTCISGAAAYNKTEGCRHRLCVDCARGLILTDPGAARIAIQGGYREYLSRSGLCPICRQSGNWCHEVSRLPLLVGEEMVYGFHVKIKMPISLEETLYTSAVKDPREFMALAYRLGFLNKPGYRLENMSNNMDWRNAEVQYYERMEFVWFLCLGCHVDRSVTVGAENTACFHKFCTGCVRVILRLPDNILREGDRRYASRSLCPECNQNGAYRMIRTKEPCTTMFETEDENGIVHDDEGNASIAESRAELSVQAADRHRAAASNSANMTRHVRQNIARVRGLEDATS